MICGDRRATVQIVDIGFQTHKSRVVRKSGLQILAPSRVERLGARTVSSHFRRERNDDQTLQLSLGGTLGGTFFGIRGRDACIRGCACCSCSGVGALAPIAEGIAALCYKAFAPLLTRAIIAVRMRSRNHRAESKSHERAAYKSVVRHVVLHCQKDTNRCWRLDHTCSCNECEMNLRHKVGTVAYRVLRNVVVDLLRFID